MTLIKVALFDMAATTVDDMVQKPGSEEKLPLVIAAYEDAFKQGSVEMPFDELNDCRGRDKLEVFREKVGKYRQDLTSEAVESLAKQLHDEHFVPALLSNVQYVNEVPGTTEAFEYLKDKGVFIATGSGFPKVVTDAINKKLGWLERGLVHYGTCGESAGGGRPKPNMINEVLLKAGLINEGENLSETIEGFNYSMVLKIGDTQKDIEEGLGVGATTIAVSSGTQSIEKLVNANPTIVLPSVAVLSQYLDNHEYSFKS
jgi:phosphoglycolate phosphatase-like HAD superfamily hydrolase